MTFEFIVKTAKTFLAVLCVSVLVACSAPEKAASDKNADNMDFADVDPYESLNREIFAFNLGVDKIVLKPVAQGYDYVVPARGKVMVSNFVNNIKEPITFANSVFQVDPQNGMATFWRFLINSSFGIGGLFDVATEIGLVNRETNMSDTLAIYGVGSGPYFVIPVIGPSTTRESFGRLGDLAVDPITYTNNAIFYSVVGIKTVDTRYNKMQLLDDVYGNSLDPYSTLRSLYLQHRASEVKKIKEKRAKSQEAAFKGNDK